jgi:putative ABC transport system ATP-binding protein
VTTNCVPFGRLETSEFAQPIANTPIISARGLNMTYRMGDVQVYALRGLDLDVGRGEFVCVVGPSGSGKSTLFYILGGLMAPTSGKVVVNGEDLFKMGDRERTKLRQKMIGFVFQKYNLLPSLTARDNVELARDIAGIHEPLGKEFDDMLRLIGIDGRMSHKPRALSAGEQQRVAIARAIVNHPAILLADEPTGNLDSNNSRAVMAVLRDLNQRMNQTILVITHDNEVASYGDRILHMRDGRIEAESGYDASVDGSTDQVGRD